MGNHPNEQDRLFGEAAVKLGLIRQIQLDKFFNLGPFEFSLKDLLIQQKVITEQDAIEVERILAKNALKTNEEFDTIDGFGVPELEESDTLDPSTPAQTPPKVEIIEDSETGNTLWVSDDKDPVKLAGTEPESLLEQGEEDVGATLFVSTEKNVEPPSPADEANDGATKGFDSVGDEEATLFVATHSNSDAAPVTSEPPSLPSKPPVPPMPPQPSEDSSHESQRAGLRIATEHPGRYKIIKELGRGGIGRVMVAEDDHLGRPVAIKQLLKQGVTRLDDPNLTSDPTLMRFLLEAKVTSQLEHPGIVPVHEVGMRQDGSFYYTMKVVKGKTLKQLSTGKDLAGRLKLLPHLIDLSQTIAYAHSRGVIHRDIKPQNLMIGEFGETVLLDWGLVKVEGEKDLRESELHEELQQLKNTSSLETAQGRPMGTPAYMSPEQAEGRISEIDARSDVWSLGAMLYELLTGRPPHIGKNAWEVVNKVINVPIAPVETLEPNAPPELSAICMRCLEHEPENRYASAMDLAGDLDNFHTGGLVSAFTYSIPQLIRRWIEKHKAIVATASAGLLALLILAVYSYVTISLKNVELKFQRDEAVAARQEARQNLEQLYLQRAAAAEEERKWDQASVYYSSVLSETRDQAALNGLYRSLSAPGSPQLTFTAPMRKRFYSLIAAPGGETMWAGESNGILQSWRLSDGHPNLPHGVFIKQISAMAISKSGKRLAVAGQDTEDRLIKILSLPDYRVLAILRGHGQLVSAMAFLDDDRMLASVSWDGSLRYWDLSLGKQVLQCDIDQGFLWSLDVTEDESVVVVGGSRGAFTLLPALECRQYVSVQHVPIEEDESSFLYGLKFCGDDRYVIAADSHGFIKRWTLDSTIKELDLGRFFGEAYNLACSSGRWIVIGEGGHVLSGSVEPDEEETTRHWQDGVHDLWAATWLPGGEQIAIAGGDGVLRIRDRRGRLLRRTPQGHFRDLKQLSFDRTGERLASVDKEGETRIWDLSEKKMESVKPGNVATSLAPAPDGWWSHGFVSPLRYQQAKEDKIVLWQSGGIEVGLVDKELFFRRRTPDVVGSKDSIHSPRAPEWALLAPIPGVSDMFSDDFQQKLAYLTESGDVFVLGSDGQRWELPQAMAYRAAFTPNGTVLAVADMEEKLHMWRLEKGGKLEELYDPCPIPAVKRIVPFTDTSIVGLLLNDGSFVILEIPSKTTLATLIRPGYPYLTAKAHPFKTMAALGGQSGRLEVFDFASAFSRTSVSYENDIEMILPSANGTRYYASFFPSQVVQSDIHGRILWSQNPTMGKIIMALSPDESLLAVSSDMMHELVLLDTSNGDEKQRLMDADASIQALLFHPTTSRLATLDGENTASIWQVQPKLTRKRSLEIPEGQLLSIAALKGPEERWITGCENGAILIWSGKTGEILKTLPGHLASVTSLAVSPDGRVLASGGADFTIRLWNLETGDVLARMQGHAKTVTSLDFSRDGKYLISLAEKDKTILWDMGRKHSLIGFEKLGSQRVCFMKNANRFISTKGKRAYSWPLLPWTWQTQGPEIQKKIFNGTSLRLDGLDVKPASAVNPLTTFF